MVLVNTQISAKLAGMTDLVSTPHDHIIPVKLNLSASRWKQILDALMIEKRDEPRLTQSSWAEKLMLIGLTALEAEDASQDDSGRAEGAS